MEDEKMASLLQECGTNGHQPEPDMESAQMIEAEDFELEHYSDVSDLELLSETEDLAELNSCKTNNPTAPAAAPGSCGPGTIMNMKDDGFTVGDSEEEAHSEEGDSDPEEPLQAYDEDETVETVHFNAAQDIGEGIKVGGLQTIDIRAEAEGMLTRLAAQAVAQENEQDFLPKPWLDTVHDEVLVGYAKRQVGRIAEVGCKNGDLLAQVAAEFPATECFGIDIDPKQVARAQLQSKEINKSRAAMIPGQSYVPELRFLGGDATDLKPLARKLAETPKPPSKMTAEDLKRSHAAIWNFAENGEEEDQDDEDIWEDESGESLSGTDEEKEDMSDTSPLAKRRKVTTFPENSQVGNHVFKFLNDPKSEEKPKSYKSSFDVFIVSHLLSDVGPKQRKQALRTAKKALRPGGALLVSATATSEDLHPAYSELYRRDVKSTKELRTFHKQDSTGKVVGTTHHFVEKELRSLIKSSGFQIMNVEKSRTALPGRGKEKDWQFYVTAARPLVQNWPFMQEPRKRRASEVHLAELAEGVFDVPMPVPNHLICESEDEQADAELEEQTAKKGKKSKKGKRKSQDAKGQEKQDENGTKNNTGNPQEKDDKAKKQTKKDKKKPSKVQEDPITAIREVYMKVPKRMAGRPRKLPRRAPAAEISEQ